MEKENKTTNKNIHAAHRARMKKIFLERGFDSFTEIQKVEYFLFFAVPFKDTNPLAHRLLDEFKNINGILNASYEKLMSIEGVGEHVAIFLKTTLAVIGDYHKGSIEEKVKINGTNSACSYCKSLFVGKQYEELIIICLNSQNDIIYTKTISKGGLSKINVELSDITKFVLNSNCERIIVTHNHPVGTPEPSDEDYSFTSRLYLNLGLNNIDLLDHIVVSPYGTYSMKAQHKLETIINDVVRKYNLKPHSPREKCLPYSIFD